VTLKTEGSMRITVVGDQSWKEKLRTSNAEIQSGVEAAITRGLLLLKGDVQHRISGQSSAAPSRGRVRNDGGRDRRFKLKAAGSGDVVLNKRTGTLFKSIHSTIRRAGADSPFFQPSLEKHRNGIVASVRNALREAIS